MGERLFAEFEDVSRYIRIEGVAAGSIAEELGVEVGDNLVRINGNTIRDFIDYRFLITDTYLEIEIIKNNGECWILEVEKDYDEPLGIEFSEIVFDGLKQCHNNCIFCFVKQTAPNTRKTLNLKDDDYRFSFLGGSYTTLTNLSDEEFQRIKQMHLSPLHVSVHSTDPEVRVRMLRNKKAGRILEQIRDLVGAGIELNTQVVLCPGINDGKILEKTIRDLEEFLPQVKSLAIVPVGLTKYRDDLDELRTFTPKEAKEVIKMVKEWQNKFREEYDSNFIYLSDEFYLLAGEEVPSTDYYDDFLQLENGVGMVRLLLDEFEAVEEKLPQILVEYRKVTMVTSVSGTKAIEAIINRLNRIDNLDIQLITVENQYFGPTVTVTGLLTGADILNNLSRIDGLGDVTLIPEIVLNDDGLFLDDLSWEDFVKEVPNQVVKVKNQGIDLVEKVLGYNFGGGDNDKTSSCNCR
jgi:putative radical SAM enzyme (TIGR03279 family)